MHVSDARKNRAAEGAVLNSGHYFVVHDHLAKHGVTLEDVLRHGYWIDTAKKFDVGHEVKVLAADLSFRVVLLVEQCQANVGAKMAILEYIDLTKADRSDETVTEDLGLEVRFRGAMKWSVLDEQGSVIKEGLDTEAEAIKELKSYAAVLSRTEAA